jgi:hypothetical protein
VFFTKFISINWEFASFVHEIDEFIRIKFEVEFELFGELVVCKKLFILFEDLVQK